MEQYNVTGMSCAACSARVEKAVSKVPGVASCSVSLLTNSMGVEGTASSAEIIKAVQDAGYGASPKRAGAAAASSTSADLDALADHETPKLKRRLIASLGFLLVLMYFSMGHMMWGWPLPHWFDGNHVAMGLVQLLLAGIVMVINQEFFVSGTKSLLRGSPNMDTLVSLGAAASYGWSVYALFAMTDAQLHGGSEAAMAYMDEFYFESAAMILTLITVGIGDDLPPLALVAVALVCIGVIALGITESNEDEELRRARQDESNRHYAKSWLAIALPVIYCLLDALGTFADSRVLEKLGEELADACNVAYELTFLVMGIACAVYVLGIKKQRLIPRQEGPKYIGAVCETIGQFFYIYALSDTEHVAFAAPIISSYCVASVIWGRIFLKEKLSKKHYACIALVVAGIVILGILDI